MLVDSILCLNTHCGRTFEPLNKASKFCSKTCRTTYYNQKQKAANAEIPMIIIRCQNYVDRIDKRLTEMLGD